MSEPRKAIRDAFDVVEFYASKTWTHQSNDYQRANQDLYVRECKTREALSEGRTRPRTVKDTIPQSKLAQYGNYEYNESRELSYASITTSIPFYYPSICPRSRNNEPWMDPEVEQLFIWLCQEHGFSLLDAHESDQVEYNHKMHSMFHDMIERKQDDVSGEEVAKYSPSPLKVETFEDMMLKIKITSENVKCLWNDAEAVEVPVQPKTHNERKSNVPESQGNLSRWWSTAGDVQDRTKEFKELQDLAASFRDLKRSIIDSSTGARSTAVVPESTNAETIAPTRRLYSAVLQGLNSAPIFTVPQIPTTTSQPTIIAALPKPEASSSSRNCWTPPTLSSPSPAVLLKNVTSVNISTRSNCNLISTATSAYSNEAQQPSGTSAYFGETCINNHINLNVYNIYNYSPTNHNYFSNVTTQNVYQSTCNRMQPVWYVPPQRVPMYTFPHYQQQPYLFIPPVPKTNQRWTLPPTQYVRVPQYQQPYHVTPPPATAQFLQNWNATTTLRKSSSYQQVTSIARQISETTSSTIPSGPSTIKRRFESSNENSKSNQKKSEKQITIKKPSSLMVIQSCEAGKSKSEVRVLQPIQTLSEELEREALEQYQESDVCLDLEREAEEQYDES